MVLKKKAIMKLPLTQYNLKPISPQEFITKRILKNFHAFNMNANSRMAVIYLRYQSIITLNTFLELIQLAN